MAYAMPWTHFFVARDGRITGFVLDTCENCGRPVQLPNAPTLVESVARLVRLGMTESKELPPEIWHDDELGHTVCERWDCKNTVQG